MFLKYKFQEGGIRHQSLLCMLSVWTFFIDILYLWKKKLNWSKLIIIVVTVIL